MIGIEVLQVAFKGLQEIEMSPRKGIYFLIKTNELRYIGKALDVHSRIGAHRKKRIDFDRVFYLPIQNPKKASELETELIKKYRPPLNIVDNPDKRALWPKNYEGAHIKIPKNRLAEKFNRFRNPEGVLALLSPQQRKIIEHRYGINGKTRMTLRKLGKLLGISGERVRQLQVKAERRLLHPTRTDLWD